MYTAPSGAPQSVRAIASSNSISIEWREVSCLDANGVIESYTLRYGFGDTLNTSVSVSTAATITGLSLGEMYRIEVAASNSLGMGPFSESVLISLQG